MGSTLGHRGLPNAALRGHPLLTDAILTHLFVPPESAHVNRTPILELTDGQQLEQPFRAADKQLRVNRQGGKYILLRLADRTGVIAGMLWNADERVFDSFDRGDYIFCRGRTQIHNGALQVIVSGIERMDPSEVNVSDFEQFDAEETDRLEHRLREMIGQLPRPRHCCRVAGDGDGACPCRF